jgi:hypothetical protein
MCFYGLVSRNHASHSAKLRNALKESVWAADATAIWLARQKERKDVDIERFVKTVRGSKFGKPRSVSLILPRRAAWDFREVHRRADVLTA